MIPLDSQEKGNTDMAEKLCIFCTHSSFDTSGCSGDYPDPATFECGKGHFNDLGWGKNSIGYDMDSFRQLILAAATCPDYDQVKV